MQNRVKLFGIPLVYKSLKSLGKISKIFLNYFQSKSIAIRLNYERIQVSKENIVTYKY
jgi:hypothetical protein